jgi:hypothetical protein
VSLLANLVGAGCCDNTALNCTVPNVADLRIYSAAGCSGGYRVYPFSVNNCNAFSSDDYNSVFASVEGDVITVQFYSDDSCVNEVLDTNPLMARTGTKSFTKGQCVESANPAAFMDDGAPYQSFKFMGYVPDTVVVTVVKLELTFQNIDEGDLSAIEADVAAGADVDPSQVEATIRSTRRRRDGDVIVDVKITVANALEARTVSTAIAASPIAFTTLAASNPTAVVPTSAPTPETETTTEPIGGTSSAHVVGLAMSVAFLLSLF